MIDIVRSLEPEAFRHGPRSSWDRERAIYLALQYRAQRQLKIFWQYAPNDPEAAAKDTFESLLCNFETCSVTSSTARS